MSKNGSFSLSGAQKANILGVFEQSVLASKKKSERRAVYQFLSESSQFTLVISTNHFFRSLFIFSQ